MRLRVQSSKAQSGCATGRLVPCLVSLLWFSLAVLAVLAVPALCFLAGGVVGAFGFRRLGYALPGRLAVLLATIALVPTIDVLRRRAARAAAD